MTRWYGLTFQGIDDTEDGTGINIDTATRILKALNKKPVIRVVMFPDIDPKVYVPICQAIKAEAALIMLQPIDSEDMRLYSPRGYGKQMGAALYTLRPYIDYLEIANEVNGTRDDKQWPGTQAYDKLKTASSVALHNNIPRVVTLYLDNDDPGFVWEWISAHPFKAEAVLMSDYQRSSQNVPLGLSGVMKKLSAAFSQSVVGIGEYGCENAQGIDDATNDERRAMISDFEMSSVLHRPPNGIGGGFFWDAYKWLQNPEYLDWFNRLWSGK